MGGAARRWAAALEALAIPEAILDAAPESPWGFDVGLFSRIADARDRRDTPAGQRALEALPEGGSVLDVGCGAGAASLALVPPAGELVGVDPSAGMLAAFAERAGTLGVAHREIEGGWPEAADRTPAVDVVVCHNVLYGVPAILPFAEALTRHARGRVVVEITAEHPLAWMAPLWRELHGLDRPSGPTADQAVAALREAGLPVAAEPGERRSRSAEDPLEERIAFARRRLCLPADRDDEVRAALERHPRPEVQATLALWWDVG
jgi:SAM-dependent methyltransferase